MGQRPTNDTNVGSVVFFFFFFGGGEDENSNLDIDLILSFRDYFMNYLMRIPSLTNQSTGVGYFFKTAHLVS